jgi:putative ABC transport system permease protein
MESNFFNYVVLKKGYDLKDLEAKLPAMVEKYMGPQIKEAMGISYSDFTKDNQVGLFLQPLTDIHLASDFSSNSELEQGGDITYVYIFSAVAIFMLLIACINFMNLSTAAASKRAKEVGIRKVLGTKRYFLVHQFLTEAFLTTAMAMVLAMALVLVLLPFFNDLAQKELHIVQLVTPQIVLALLALTFFISFLAGGYPAFFLSSFRPLEALQSKFSGGGKSIGVRSGLVVFQFVISAGLILATLVVDQQMNFIQNKNLGYDKDGLLVLRDAYLLNNDQEAFKNALLQDPRIENVTTSAFVPAGATDNGMSGVYVGEEGSAIRRMSVYNIDDRYLPTMGMQLLAGRNFSDEYGSDSLNVIINETAARILGYGQDAVGRTLTQSLDNFGKTRELTIVGVVRDFHFTSLHQRIEPLIMLNHGHGGLIIRSKASYMAGLIKDINGLWDRFGAKEPFGYALLDESYRHTYVAEQKMGNILRIFALLTIFVACLGLFGLVTFTTQQRFKEIGIRKVLGSSVPEIVALLSKDFVKLVLISFLIAFPLGFYLMDSWLQEFAYGIEIQWWVYALTGGITLLIAFFTIGFKSIRVALMNPVESLRTE